MTQWFKMIEGAIEDTRLAVIAKRLGIKRTAVQAAWWLALDMASKSDVRGRFSPDAAEIELMACMLDETVQDVESIVAEFKARGMVNDGIIADWVKDQSVSSAGAKRMAKWRERQAEASRRLKSDARNVTSDAETVTSGAESLRREEEEEREPPLPPEAGGGEEKAFSEFWKARPDLGSMTDSRKDAEREFYKLLADGESAAAIIAAMRSYAAWAEREKADGKKYFPATAKFLSEGLWRDVPAQDAAAPMTFNDLPDWQRHLCAFIEPVKVSSWFSGASVEGDVITAKSKTAADFIRANFDQALRSVFGKKMEVRA